MSITFDTGSVAVLAASGTEVSAPSITTAEAGELLIAFRFGGDNVAVSNWRSTDPSIASGTLTTAQAQPPAGRWIEVVDGTTAVGADTAASFAHAVKTTAGATGDVLVTAAGAARHGMFVAAFKLPPSGPVVYRPGSDITANGWTATPGGSLASCIDDTALDPADYITSPDTSTPVTLGWAVPVPAGSWDISMNVSRTGGGGQVRLVFLDAGSVVVGTSPWQAAPAAADTLTFAGVTTTAQSTQFRIEVQP